MDAKLAYKIAQILMAAEKKAKKPPIADQMRNEAYPRTFTDEYPWVKPSRPRADRLSEEQKREMEALAAK